MAEAARELGIELSQPDSVNDDAARGAIAATRPQTLVVCAFGALIKEPLLSDYPLLNVHPSLLPRWRGAAPVERTIMSGDPVTGVSIMEVTAGLDSGPVCAQAQEPVSALDTYGTLSARLEPLGAKLLIEVLDHQPPCVAQDDARATYAEKITDADRRLDPAHPASELERSVRALHPHIGAYLELAGGERLGVKAARVRAEGPPVGEFWTGDARPVLGCAEGALELITVQPAGRREMSAEEYLRGRRGAGAG